MKVKQKKPCKVKPSESWWDAPRRKKKKSTKAQAHTCLYLLQVRFLFLQTSKWIGCQANKAQYPRVKCSLQFVIAVLFSININDRTIFEPRLKADARHGNYRATFTLIWVRVTRFGYGVSFTGRKTKNLLSSQGQLSSDVLLCAVCYKRSKSRTDTLTHIQN